jgi:hydrogenase nickel incorporation protein HypA/HybF
MHELSVCQGLLAQVETLAAQHAAQRVVSITLHIGPLSGVEAGLLQQAFSLARAGTCAAQAALVIESLPVRVRCQRCAQESEVLPNRLLCGHCGDYHTQLISGDEMLLASLELDVDSDKRRPQTSSQADVMISGDKYV